MRHIVLSRPYLATWLTGYLFLWGEVLIEYPASLFILSIISLLTCSLMAIPWVLLAIASSASLIKSLRHGSRTRNKRLRSRSRSRQRSPSSPAIELPDLSAGGHAAPDNDLGHAQASIASYILRSYIMQPHIHTSMIHYRQASDMEDAYVQVREHFTSGKTPQFYQDLCLASISAYCAEQKLGYIPGENSRLMITQAKQACRQFIISQGEHRDEVVDECYRALSAQAENLVDILLPSLKKLSGTLREPLGPNPFVLHEADILRWHQYMREQFESQLQEKIAA